MTASGRVALRLLHSEKVRHSGRRSREAKDITLTTYDVLLDGEPIGQVERAMLTREQRTPGRRYVNARWSSPGWRYRGPSRSWGGFEVLSRREGILQLLHDAGIERREAEMLARSVNIVRPKPGGPPNN